MLNPPLQQKISWFTVERREWVVAVILAAGLGFGIGNGHTTSGAIKHVSWQLGEQKKAEKKLETVDIPKLKAQAGCEHARGQKILEAATVDNAPMETLPNRPALSTLKSLGKVDISKK